MHRRTRAHRKDIDRLNGLIAVVVVGLTNGHVHHSPVDINHILSVLQRETGICWQLKIRPIGPLWLQLRGNSVRLQGLRQASKARSGDFG